MVIKILMILLTIVAYIVSVNITKLKYLSKIPIVILSVMIVYVVLSLINFDVEIYQKYNSLLFFLLGPAIVALSIPLIRNINVLKKNYSVLLLGVTLATIFTVLSVICVAYLFKLDFIVIKSMIPKTVTVPVAIEITKLLSGKVELTIILVMFSGLFGAIFGHSILNFIKVKNNVAVGFSLGFLSHILGTAVCLEKNSLQAAVSTITLILSCISTAIIAPILINIIF